jgi:hypothetical protein
MGVEGICRIRIAPKVIWGCVQQLSIEYEDEDMCYCDIASRPISWEHYSLLLQLAHEKREIVVCADTRNLVRKPWTRLTAFWILLTRLPYLCVSCITTFHFTAFTCEPNVGFNLMFS